MSFVVTVVKTVLIAVKYTVYSLPVVQRLLLALEWLLMTDLVAPDHVAIVCSRMLTSLYTSDTVNSAVQQKARKVQWREIISLVINVLYVTKFMYLSTCTVLWKTTHFQLTVCYAVLSVL